MAVDRAGHEQRAAPCIKRRLYALGQSAAGTRVGCDTVDHDLQPAFPFAVERGLFIEANRAAINANAHVARRLQRRKQRLRRLPHLELNRRENQQLRAVWLREDLLNGLIDALGPDGRAAVRAVHPAKPRGQHAKVVVHLGERTDRGSWRAACAPLLDRHRRRQSLDLLEERLRHLTDELPRIRRQALDVSPLPLGVERVEGERRLAAAARAAADRELPAGNVGIDLLEVVEGGTADRDHWWARIARRFLDRVEHRRHGGRRVFHLFPTDGRLSCRLRCFRRRRQDRHEGLARVRALGLRDFLGWALRHDPATAAAAFRPEVDHPVGPLHDVEVVLHHEHGVARLDEPLEHREQLPHVGHVEARRRLVQHVERFSGRAFGQLTRQLHPLGLAARERGRRLAEMEIVESHITERLEFPRDVGGVLKQLQRFADLHVQEVRNALALPANFQRVFREPGSAADVARHPHVGQKIHVEPDRAVALAGFTAAARHIETEAARLPAPLLGLGEHREEVADVVPDLHIGCRIAPRRAADRRLVDHDHLVEGVGPLDRVKVAGRRHLAAEESPQFRLQHVADERTFSTSRHTGHADQKPQRDVDVDALEVVVPHAFEPQRLITGLAPLGRQVDRIAAGEKGPGHASLALRNVVGRARRHHLAAPLAWAGTEVDHPVGSPDRIFVVLDHDDGVALVAEGFQRAKQLHIVARVQADRRLIEHVEHAREPRADLGCEPDPLALATRERGGLPVEGEIAEADLIEKRKPARDLLHQFNGDQLLRGVEDERGEKLAGIGDR